MMAASMIGEGQALQLQQRLQQHGIFVGGARRLRHRAPFGADSLPSWTAKTMLVLPASMASSMAALREKHFAGGDGAHAGPRFRAGARRRFRRCLRTRHSSPHVAAARGCARQPGRARQPASRMRRKPLAAPDLIPLGEAAARCSSASIGARRRLDCQARPAKSPGIRCPSG